MTTPAAEDIAATLRAQLAANIAQALGQYGERLSLVIQSNPGQAIATLLDRPDVAQSLTQSLAYAEQQASAAVRQSWTAHGGDITSPVYTALQADVTRAYAEAPGLINRAAGEAWHTVTQEEFEPGASTPGTNPHWETAQRRAQAVREAVSGQAQALALRNGLSVNVAAGQSRTQAFLDQAAGQEQRTGQKLGKRWVSRLASNTCAWCRWLHGKVVPVGDEFPHPPALGGHSAPRLYLGRLFGPGLHPNCRCRLETVVLEEGGLPPAEAGPGPEPGAVPEPEIAPAPEPALVPAGFVSSTDIAAMPEERYQQLRGFLRAALHELGQFLAALLGIGGQRAA